MTVDNEKFTLSPDETRLQRMVTRLKEILLDGRLSQDEAAKLAGKIQFLTETIAGQAIKSCLMPLYGHCHRTQDCDQVDMALQDAITTMIFILEHLRPKVVNFTHQSPATLYADAYFLAGDRRIKIGSAHNEEWDAVASNLMENGWGWILRLPGGHVLYAHGRIPSNIAGKFTARRAFIYAFEILAQVIPLVCCRK